MNSGASVDQYPIADRNSELQQLTFNAFRSSLPVDRFVFRPEPDPDAGVDGSIELKSGGHYLNLRAQIQLKGTDSAVTNHDGTVSVPVKVSSLRYLLNTPTGLYVLFIAPRNELRYVWARDEQRRLSKTNPDWHQQNEVTIRFMAILDGKAIEEIYQEIQKAAQLQAKVAEILSKVSNLQSVAIEIDTATLAVTDPEEVKQILLSRGTLIVTAGHADRVERLAALLDLQTARMPGILLVRAYAEQVSGRYVTASAFVSEALMHADQLSADDRQFLEFVRDTCNYQMGRLTLAEFGLRIKTKQDNQTGRFALSYRINELRQELLLTRDLGTRQELLNALRSVLTRSLDSEETSHAFKLYARSVLLEAEGQELTLRFSFESGEETLRRHLGRPDNLAQLAQDYVEKFGAWEQAIRLLTQDAAKVGHVPVVSDAILIRLSVTFYSLLLQRRLGKMLGLSVAPHSDNLQTLINEVLKIIEESVSAKRYEAELRAKVLLADYLEFAGRNAEAIDIAQEVKAKAQALNYAIPLARAEEHLTGRGPLSASDAVLKPKTEVQQVMSNAAMSDEKLRLYAAQALRLYDLPADRLRVMEREYISIRESSLDTVNWCRHLERRCDDRHMQATATMFKADPDRICICTLHGFESQISHPDWTTLSLAFKEAYCKSCKDRNPLQRKSE
jgi:hypothetical protein